MKFQQFYSGSSGNLYEVTASNGKRLLIEAGVTWAKLQKALDYDLSNFEACLCTHQHKDHCKSISDVMAAGIDVYAPHAVFESQNLFGRRAIFVLDKDSIALETFQIFVFELTHDVPIVGFVIFCDGEYLLFCTDTHYIMKPVDGKHITYEFPHKFSIIAIECSFDRDVLQKRVDLGEIHESLAKRLLTSHMEKINCMTYIRDFCKLDNCTEIHLLHLSGDNLTKRETQKEFEHEFFITTKIVGD